MTREGTIKETVRKRRTAEESRANILDVAAKRLREHGLDGLNITGVAEQAGISHATLLHHFGSSAGMRDALAEKMTHALINDLVEALNAKVPVAELLANVFDALAEGGHAKLIAWRAVDGGPMIKNPAAQTELFERLMETSKQLFEPERHSEIRQIIYLVANAAIGHGLAGAGLAAVLKLSEQEVDAFPSWMQRRLT